MENEGLLRLGVFFGLFAAFAAWELVAPMRVLRLPKGQRWATNWGISILNSVVSAGMKLLLGAAAVAAALDVEAMGWGLFNAIDWPFWLEVLIVFVLLDLAIWAQHVASHKIPLLWRLHRVHHADRDFDVTTAIRFHPLEIALSMGLKIGLVYLLGAPALAVLLFEVVLNGAAMFNHANIRLGAAERWLRLAIVTPDMHRVHHSIYRDEHDTNFGFNLSIWDRIFGTYTAVPRDGHREMAIGLDRCQTEAPARLGWSLGLPFRRL